jgi:hypothetical protein
MLDILKKIRYVMIEFLYVSPGFSLASPMAVRVETVNIYPG